MYFMNRQKMIIFIKCEKNRFLVFFVKAFSYNVERIMESVWKQVFAT